MSSSSPSVRPPRFSRHLLFIAVLTTLGLSLLACGEGDTTVVANCGPGTVDQDGQCVLSADAISDGLVGSDIVPVDCGPGTVLMGDQCVPEGEVPVCGEGTVLVNGECVPDGEAPVCGMGTVLMNGECVPETDAPTCGMGTILVNGECVPESEAPVCGAGTTLDQGTGECVPDTSVVCGDGTVADTTTGQCVADLTNICGTDTLLANGQCVPATDLARCGANTVDTNGECVPTDGTCAPGTAFDDTSGTCVPDASTCAAGTTFDAATSTCTPGPDTCATGTTFDVANGTCVPDTDIVCGAGTVVDANGNCAPEVVCGADTVAWQGECRTPIEVAIADADVLESSPDLNDPVAGTPEALTLPAIGDAIVFSGTIDTPTDLDNDGEPDVDVDAWTFTATAGDVVHLTLETSGSAPLGFRIIGPSDYTRDSPTLFELVPDKELFLPWDGDYQILVQPQITMLSSSIDAVGGPDEVYAVVLERRAAPNAVQLTTSNLTTGNLFEGDHFFRTPSAAGLYSTRLETTNLVPPAMIVADTTGTPVSEALGSGTTVSTVVPGNFVIFTDYLSALQDAGDFTLTTEAVTLIPTVFNGDLGAASTGTVSSQSAAYLSVDYTQRHVAHIRVTSPSSSVTPDMQIIDLATGEVVFSRDDVPLGIDQPWLVPSTTGGSYAVEIYNDSSTQNVSFDVSFTNWPVVSLGTVAPGISTLKTSNAGAMSAGDYRYYLLSALGGASELTFRADPGSTGTLDAIVYNEDFDTLRFDVSAGAGEDAYVPYIFTDESPSFFYLLGVRSQTASASHQVIATLRSKPRDEVEPNDTLLDSESITPPSERVVGFTSMNTGFPAPDMFNFTVPTSGTWAIQVDALTGNNCNGFELRDANNNVLTSAGGGEAYLTRFLSAGTTYVVHVAGTCPFSLGTSGGYRYVLSIFQP